jgi:hypothetical protein
MCDCGNDTVIPGTRLCKECAWAGQAYPHLFPEDHAPDGAGVDFGLQNKIDTLTFDLKVADDHITEQTTEITRLRAVNAAQSDMLKGAAAAAAQREQERVALHKLIAGVVLNLDQRSPMECMTRLMAMRREYAELCAEADHA